MWCRKTHSAKETEKLGQVIGRLLKGGEVIELSSDLGGGKTTLTKGIVSGMGSSDLVSSPTFTISNIYKAPHIEIHHYDFYRLGELGLMSDELQETLADPDSVSIIEWAGEAHDLLPKNRLIRIQFTPVKENAAHRTVTIELGSDVRLLPENVGFERC